MSNDGVRDAQAYLKSFQQHTEFFVTKKIKQVTMQNKRNLAAFHLPGIVST